MTSRRIAISAVLAAIIAIAAGWLLWGRDDAAPVSADMPAPSAPASVQETSAPSAPAVPASTSQTTPAQTAPAAQVVAPSEPATPAAPAAPATTTSTAAPAPATPAADAAGRDVLVKAPDADVAPVAAPATGSVPTPTAPSFDIVRVNPRGDTVVAGRAEPGSDVVLRDGGTEIGRARADDRGEWVILPDKPLNRGTRELDLDATLPGGAHVKSDDVVMLVVPDDAPEAATATVADRGEAAPPATQEQPLAVLVPRDGDGVGRLLQRSDPDAAGVSQGPLSLEVIDYDAEGRVSLSGRAKAGSEVRIYLDNDLIATARPDPDRGGLWVVTPEGRIPEGKAMLRLDLIDGDGTVLARLETPFSRAASPMLLPEGQTYVVIQPGDYLWRIARATYGQGLRYTTIFEANRDQIRNPDLIYPGQVFVLPEGQS
ncbi:LysM peptidoglycan-binding domain-containing protein [Tistrella bauzanensis]|uniref:LysM peptidoglycan-binding domain-containing protein n=1 Tax=Tistrella arctica TaxID=3133430 RepID=A0ABU9YIN1_9PROT